MARRMDYRIAFAAPAEKIYQDFTSRAYWETLMDAYRFLTPQSEITKFTSDGSGTDIVFKQNLPRMYLPPIARSVMPVDMIITREQHFDPYDHANKRGNGHLPREHPARAGPLRRQVLPHRNRYRAASCGWSASARCTSRSIGGALEDLILHHIKQLFDAEEAFTADWIAKHH